MMMNFKHILTSIDALNTLNGGASEPFLSLRENLEGREIRVRIPGINKEALKAEINDNMLSVFYSIAIQSEGKLVSIPKVVYNEAIPYFIEISEIKATYENNELVVKLPFNKRSKGYNQKIQIGE